MSFSSKKFAAQVSRWISAVVIFTFMTNTVVFGAPIANVISGANSLINSSVQISSFNPENITLPQESGSIKDYFLSNTSDNRLVIQIQDAHANYSAQKSIKTILDYFSRKQGIKLVALEGADSKIDSSLLRFYPDQKLNTQAAQYLMKEGLLSASEFFAFEHGDSVQVTGVENRQAYVENLRTFRKSYEAKQSVDLFFSEIEGLISLIKGKLIVGDLKKVLDKKLAHDNGKLSLVDYLANLSAASQKKLGLNLADPRNQKQYPNLVRISRLKAVEKNIDFKLAASDAKNLAGVLKRYQSENPKLYNLLVEDLESIGKRNSSGFVSPASLLSRDPRLFFELLHTVAIKHQINLEKQNAFLLYGQFLILQKEVNGDGLYQEVEQLEAAVLQSLVTNQQQKELLDLIVSQDLLKRFFTLEATKKDVGHFLANKSRFTPEAIVKSLMHLKEAMGFEKTVRLRSNVKEVSRAVSLAEHFYEVAGRRDAAFVDNLVQKMQDGNLDKAILITGGFHTEGLSDLLKSLGISYVVVAPQISGENSREKYLKLITGKETLIKDTKLNGKALDLAKILADSFLDVDRPGRKSEALIAALLHTLPAYFSGHPTTSLSGLTVGGVRAEVLTVSKTSDAVTVNVSVAADREISNYTTTGTAGDVNHVTVKLNSTKLAKPETVNARSLGIVQDVLGRLVTIRGMVEKVSTPHDMRIKEEVLLTIDDINERLSKSSDAALTSELEKVLVELSQFLSNGGIVDAGISQDLIKLMDLMEDYLTKPWVKELNAVLALRGLELKQIFDASEDREGLKAMISSGRPGDIFILYAKNERGVKEKIAYVKLDRARYQIRTAPLTPDDLKNARKKAFYFESLLAFANLYVTRTGHLLQLKCIGSGKDLMGFLHGSNELYHNADSHTTGLKLNRREQDFSELKDGVFEMEGRRKLYGGDLLREEERVLHVEYGFKGNEARTIVTPRSRSNFEASDRDLEGYSFLVVPKKTVLIFGSGTIAGHVGKRLLRFGINVVAANRSPNDNARSLTHFGIPLYAMFPENEKTNEAAFKKVKIPVEGDVLSLLRSGQVDLIVEGVDKTAKTKDRGEVANSVTSLEDILSKVPASEKKIPVLFQGSNDPEGLFARVIETQSMEVLGLNYSDIRSKAATEDELKAALKEGGMKPEIRNRINPVFIPSCNTTSLLMLFGWLGTGQFQKDIKRIIVRVHLHRRTGDPGKGENKLTPQGTEVDMGHHGAEDAMSFILQLEKDKQPKFYEKDGKVAFKTKASFGPQTKFHVGIADVLIEKEDGSYMSGKEYKQFLARIGRVALIDFPKDVFPDLKGKKFSTENVFDFVTNRMEVTHPMVVPAAVYDQDPIGFTVVFLTPQESNVIPNNVAATLLELGIFGDKHLAYGNEMVNSIHRVDRFKIRLENQFPAQGVEHVNIGEPHDFKNGKNGNGNGASLGSVNRIQKYLIELGQFFDFGRNPNAQPVEHVSNAESKVTVGTVQEILGQIPRQAGLEAGLTLEGVLAASRTAYRTIRPELPAEVSDYLFNQLFSENLKSEAAVETLKKYSAAHALFNFLFGSEKPNLGVTVTTTSIASPEGTVTRLLSNEASVAVLVRDSEGSDVSVYTELIGALKLSDEKKAQLANRLILVDPIAFNDGDIKSLITNIMSGRRFQIRGGELTTLAKIAGKYAKLGQGVKLDGYLKQHTVVLADYQVLPDANRVPGIQLISVEHKKFDATSWREYRLLASGVAMKLASAGKAGALPYEIRSALKPISEGVFGFQDNLAEILASLSSEVRGYFEFAHSA
ncbi:MAG: hypothetical protein HZC17_00205 [Candidatus Omnitrophica bacterium]|nr:hypothetical protein [Candidatus Omnitrophota bacterium]